MLANFCILMGKPIEMKTQSVNIFICGQLYVFALFFFSASGTFSISFSLVINWWSSREDIKAYSHT